MKTIEIKYPLIKKTSVITSVFFTLLFSLTTLSVHAEGGVGLTATRIVYEQGISSVAIGARNTTDINYLAKFTVTTNGDGSPSANTPFSISPPLIKIESHQIQDIKIYELPSTLPKDRESLFYFSALMIPSTKGPVQSSALNIGYNNIIKLFYRPNNLQMTVKEAYQKLAVKATPTGISVINESPYYISMNSITINGVKVDMSMKNHNTMVSPYSSLNYNTPANARSGATKISVINDLGGDEIYNGQVQ